MLGSQRAYTLSRSTHTPATIACTGRSGERTQGNTFPERFDVMPKKTQRRGTDGRPRVISLFSGAMGLDLGLEKAGFQTCVAVESNPTAVETIRVNRPTLPVLDREVERTPTDEILAAAGVRAGEVELIAGGPACQSFSTAGKRQSVGDPGGRLFFDFMRVVEEAKPRFFLMENVRGLLSAAVQHRPLAKRGEGHPPLSREEELGSAFQQMTERIRRSGYHAVFDVLNAANFGVAQTRLRLVIVGSRDGVPISMPTPSHDKDGLHGLPQWRTVREALLGLDDSKPEFNEFPPSQRDYFKLIPSGGNWKDLPTNIINDALGGAAASWGGRTGFFRRLAWDQPSPTLNTDPKSKATSLCHPEELRPLSVREYARIQGFSDDWIIRGSTGEKYRQLGNAVPVNLASAVGKTIVQSLKSRGSKRRIGKVECHNLRLLESLSKQRTTQLNPPRMRSRQDPIMAGNWKANRPPSRNYAVQYTPDHLIGSVGKTKLAKRVVEELTAAYQMSTNGSFEDPVEELFFALISLGKRDPTLDLSYEALRSFFRECKESIEQGGLNAGREISYASLSRQRVEHIMRIGNLLYAKFGEVTLNPVENSPNPDLKAFLTSLPGVGIKTAKSVMLFGMGRQVLPSSTNVMRIVERVGLVTPQISRPIADDVLESIITPELRPQFHVNAITHGRTVCRVRNPICPACPIRHLCQRGSQY